MTTPQQIYGAWYAEELAAMAAECTYEAALCVYCGRPHLDEAADLCQPCDRCLWPEGRDRL